MLHQELDAGHVVLQVAGRQRPKARVRVLSHQQLVDGDLEWRLRLPVGLLVQFEPVTYRCGNAMNSLATSMSARSLFTASCIGITLMNSDTP